MSTYQREKESKKALAWGWQCSFFSISPPFWALGTRAHVPSVFSKPSSPTLQLWSGPCWIQPPSLTAMPLVLSFHVLPDVDKEILCWRNVRNTLLA